MSLFFYIKPKKCYIYVNDVKNFYKKNYKEFFNDNFAISMLDLKPNIGLNQLFPILQLQTFFYYLFRAKSLDKSALVYESVHSRLLDNFL